MRDKRGLPRRIARLMVVAVAMVLPLTVLAKKPKSYPLEGKVTGTGVGEHIASFPGVHTVHTRTYKVETDARIYKLECENDEGCGGDRKLQVGDVIHFRMEKDRVYIPVVETTTDSYSYVKETTSREQKLRIVDEELKPDAKPTDPTPAAQQGEAKPQGL